MHRSPDVTASSIPDVLGELIPSAVDPVAGAVAASPRRTA